MSKYQVHRGHYLMGWHNGTSNLGHLRHVARCNIMLRNAALLLAPDRHIFSNAAAAVFGFGSSCLLDSSKLVSMCLRYLDLNLIKIVASDTSPI